MKETGKVWRKQNVETLKSQIRAELDSISEAFDQRKRLHHALDRVRKLEEDGSPSGSLRRFIYAVSALLHHLRHGGLSHRQIKNLTQLATALLKIQGIRPISSKLSYLFGDLHLILSQISRKEGRLWESTWEQLTSWYLSQRAPAGGKAYQAYALGRQAIRIAQGTLALQEFDTARKLPLPAKYVGNNEIEYVKTLRLTGNIEKAIRAATKAKNKSKDYSDAIKQELEWESLCHGVTKTGKLTKLVSAIKRGNSHHSPDYIIETFLWTRTVQSREWLTRFPKLRSLTRHRDMNRRQSGMRFECAEVLEVVYDHQIPYELRLERMGKLLSNVPLLPGIDTELLVWASATRWLARNRSFRFAALTLGEYQKICFSLSAGNTGDILGQMKDLEGYIAKHLRADGGEDEAPSAENDSAA